MELACTTKITDLPWLFQPLTKLELAGSQGCTISTIHAKLLAVQLHIILPVWP